MTLLISGLALFVLSHLVPSFPAYRQKLVDSFGAGVYRGLFSLVSVLSLVLIVWGLKDAEIVSLYQPPLWGRYATYVLAFVALYLFFSNPLAPAPSSAKVLTAHPLNWGVICWSAGHLLSNGHLAHVVLFATFLVFSIVSILTGNARGQKPALTQRPAPGSELVFIAIVFVIYTAVFWGHRYFTGMPLI